MKTDPTVQLAFRDQQYTLRSGMTARSAVLKIGFDPNAVLIVRNGELITDDEILDAGDQVRLVPVISGGCAP